MVLGKIHRFFAEIRRAGNLMQTRGTDVLAGRALQARLTVRRENPLLAEQLPREPRALAPKFPQSKR